MDPFIKEAIKEAEQGLREGGIPVGAVLVKNGRIVGRGHNKQIQEGDPVGHAEIDCLRNAGRIGDFSETVLYSTMMPCYLCAGGIFQLGIKKVVAGDTKTAVGAKYFLEQHGIEVVDLDLDECKQLMVSFIKAKPELWWEEIGIHEA